MFFELMPNVNLVLNASLALGTLLLALEPGVDAAAVENVPALQRRHVHRPPASLTSPTYHSGKRKGTHWSLDWASRSQWQMMQVSKTIAPRIRGYCSK